MSSLQWLLIVFGRFSRGNALNSSHFTFWFQFDSDLSYMPAVWSIAQRSR